MASRSKLPPHVFDETQLRTFLGHVLDPETGCAELRIFRADYFMSTNFVVAGQRYSRTFGGWFNRVDDLVADASRVRGVSAYITVNPASFDLLGRASNRVITLQRGQGTNDEAIVCLRWLYIDLDVKRLPDIPSTDAELQSALDLRGRILATHPEIARVSLWGCSGNGGWILVRLPDYPNNEENINLIGRTLDNLAERFGKEGRDSAFVDSKTRNPSRVMCLPGTQKAKGENLPDRPWRPVTVEGYPDSSSNSGVLDLVDWLKANKVKGLGTGVSSHATQGGGIANGQPNPHPGLTDRDQAKRLRRAEAYIMASSFAPAVSGQRGHDQTFDAACALIKGFNLTVDEARPILARYNATRCVPPWSEAELEHKLRDADQKADGKPRGYLWEVEDPNRAKPASRRGKNRYKGPADQTEDDELKIEIEVRDTSLSMASDLALLAMAAHNDPPEIFDFGGNLAWIKMTSDSQNFPFIEIMNFDAIRNRLSDIAMFVEVYEGERGSRKIEVFPPLAIVRAVASQKSWSTGVAPPLEILVESPRFLRDGRLVTRPGYYPEANLFYRPPEDLSRIDVKPEPTTDDVNNAKYLIFDRYLVDFQFADSASKANALACMLLPFVRLMINGQTPLHFFEASTEGTGKGKLANACAYPSLGREIHSTSQKENEGEWRKAITSSLLTGRTHFFIDNMNNPRDWSGNSQPFDSGTLASALTQGYWEDRLLGGNKNAIIKIQCIWIGSGNNVEWSKELARRVVSIRLQASSDNPSSRKGFRCEPDTLEEWAAKNRVELLRACLTLCQYWIANGMRNGSVAYGSYENYSRVMSGILEAIGVSGFLENRIRTTTKDRETIRWTALVKAWAAQYERHLVSTADIYDLMFGCYDGEKFVDGDSDLQILFADVIGEGKQLSQKQRLGNALRKQEDRVWGNWRIVSAGMDASSKAVLYKLVDPKESLSYADDVDEESEGSEVNLGNTGNIGYDIPF